MAKATDELIKTHQIRTLLEAHFKKEKEALYPLAEKAMDSVTLKRLGDEMIRRELEVREVVKN